MIGAHKKKNHEWMTGEFVAEYVCSECDSQFSEQTSLVEHVKKHHWEDNIPESNSTLENKQHQLESSDESEDKDEEKEEQEEYEEKT